MNLRINILYWIVVPSLIAGIWFLYNDMSYHKNEFLGFAENQQTEINSEQDVFIETIKVKTGDKVRKGDTLVLCARYNWDEEILQTDLKIEEIRLKTTQKNQEINRIISELEQEMTQKLATLQTKINNEDSESKFYKSLSDHGETNSSKNNYLLENLVAEYNTVKSSYQKLIKAQKDRFGELNPDFTMITQLEKKKSHLKYLRERLTILSPDNGIIGNLNIKEGENIRAFTNMITLYEERIPSITGYINEKFTSQIEIGDSVNIYSLYHPEKKSKGIVRNKGQRMIEIPEKFRRIPEYKTYGVEIFMEIDTQNHFLQKEVVVIKTLKK